MGERRLILDIFKNFWLSLRPRQIRGNKIGTDYLGNTYFEIPANRQQGKKKDVRWFTPQDADAFDEEKPAEWESWLRGRRKEPPTEEEIAKNLQIMEMKKVNYAELEAKYAASRPTQLTETKKIGYESFPKYDEYEVTPGESLNKKRR